MQPLLELLCSLSITMELKRGQYYYLDSEFKWTMISATRLFTWTTPHWGNKDYLFSLAKFFDSNLVQGRLLDVGPGQSSGTSSSVLSGCQTCVGYSVPNTTAIHSLQCPPTSLETCYHIALPRSNLFPAGDSEGEMARWIMTWWNGLITTCIMQPKQFVFPEVKWPHIIDLLCSPMPMRTWTIP